MYRYFSKAPAVRLPRTEVPWFAAAIVAGGIAGQAERFDLLARIRHCPFPGGALLRMPALVLGMLYYRLRDIW